jgi:hypothetical protein
MSSTPKEWPPILRIHPSMADIPDRIVLRRHRDLEGWGRFRRGRYVVIGALVAFLAAALLNVFGQIPSTVDVKSPHAKLRLYAPTRLRGGLLFEARFTIYARDELKNVLLRLAPGWNEGMQMNTIEPSPIGEGSRNGDLLFTLGHVPKGTVYRLFLQFQVNPTNVAWQRNADVTLYDGGATLIHLHHTITVFP